MDKELEGPTKSLGRVKTWVEALNRPRAGSGISHHLTAFSPWALLFLSSAHIHMDRSQAHSTPAAFSALCTTSQAEAPAASPTPRGDEDPKPWQDLHHEAPLTGYFCPYGAASALCHAGSFKDKREVPHLDTGFCSAVLSLCLRCPAGHFCPNRATYRIPCQPGTSGPQSGQDEATDCTPCPAGKACTQARLTQPDAPCSPGYVCPVGSSSPHTPSHACPPGTFSNHNDLSYLSQCEICPTGLACPEGAGSVSVELRCPQGHAGLGITVYEVSGARRCPGKVAGKCQERVPWGSPCPFYRADTAVNWKKPQRQWKSTTVNWKTTDSCYISHSARLLGAATHFGLYSADPELDPDKWCRKPGRGVVDPPQAPGAGLNSRLPGANQHGPLALDSAEPRWSSSRLLESSGTVARQGRLSDCSPLPVKFPGRDDKKGRLLLVSLLPDANSCPYWSEVRCSGKPIPRATRAPAKHHSTSIAWDAPGKVAPSTQLSTPHPSIARTLN
ncbi:hypothetical protein P7K49_029457 [Saguinus oedipus]|uniref:Uncharacterized protein n=1 Tax=Saguinus oedipus TaxID=9490 RepID=A0ABQ9U795_SAGOE|nr:hypothetical protein P7K49_029457 [Saguinus oedipus]